jgi:hypothetical protein
VNRRALAVTAVLFALGVGVDAIVGYSPFPGYGAAIGLVGCVVIIVVSKWIGATFLERPEDYYPDDIPPDVQPDQLGDPDHPDADASTRGWGGRRG